MGPFPRKLLADHETIVFDLKPHWVALVKPVLWTILIVAAWIAAFALIDPNQTAGLIISVVAVALICYFAVFPALRWATTHFVLTTDRLITRFGIVAKNSREIPLERINDVAFNQSVLERMLGAGDLLIESAGERGQNRISNVRRPEEVQLSIYKAVEENNRRDHRPQTAAGLPPEREPTVLEQIEALGRLKEQGTITETEFESKKQELLKRL
ncbi:MAG: PH domain-containing protein [Actinomycetota bacterium]